MKMTSLTIAIPLGEFDATAQVRFGLMKRASSQDPSQLGQP